MHSTRAALGLRQNLAQFMLLVAVNALVGGTLGQERTVLPLLASQTFHLDLYTSALTYILAFGLSKAAMNYFAGTLSDRYGRKPVLITGWLVAIPVPLMLIYGPSWEWIVAANVFLGVSQGLTWSTAVIMKMDLTGPKQRGLAMGLNEAAGYLGVAFTALATGYIASAYGLRPGPFLLGAAYIALGLGLSVLTIRETHHHAKMEASQHVSAHRSADSGLTTGQVFTLTSFKDRSLSAASQAGLVNNLNDGLAWGLFSGPLRYFRAKPEPSRDLGRRLPRGLGRRAALHRCRLRPMGPQMVHCGRHDRPSRGTRHSRRLSQFRGLAYRRCPPRIRNGHGLPSPPGRHRGRRPSHLACTLRRDLPALARRRLRRRSTPVRSSRRSLWDTRSHRDRRCTHSNLRPGSRRPNARQRPHNRLGTGPMANTPAPNGSAPAHYLSAVSWRRSRHIGQTSRSRESILPAPASLHILCSTSARWFPLRVGCGGGPGSRTYT